jgi:hypothetical protein
LGPGQTITVSFKLGPEQLGFWDAEAHPARFVVEPGTFGLYIGAGLRATRELTFEVRWCHGRQGGGPRPGY